MSTRDSDLLHVDLQMFNFGNLIPSQNAQLLEGNLFGRGNLCVAGQGRSVIESKIALNKKGILLRKWLLKHVKMHKMSYWKRNANKKAWKMARFAPMTCKSK